MNIDTTDFWTGEDWVSIEMSSKRTGVMKESSLNNEFGYGDMVLINSNKMEVSQVLKKNTNTTFISYDISLYGKTEGWDIIKDFFLKKELYVKFHVEGVFLLSIPLDFDDSDLIIVINSCPIKCVEIIQDEDSGDEDDEGEHYMG